MANENKPTLIRCDYEKFRASLFADETPSTSKSLETITPSTTYIADGFHEDCEEFIDEFKKKQTIRFKDFHELWRDTKFELIYSGRPSIPELLEFAEEAILIASRFLFYSKEDDEYQTAIAGLYLVYCLYNANLVAKQTHVRVTPPGITLLQELRTYALNNGHVDVLYILCSLLRDGVFKFVAKNREYGMERSYTKYKNDAKFVDYNDLQDSKCEDVDNLMDINKGTLNELDTALAEYHMAKCRLPGAKENNAPQGLDYVLKDFAKDIKKSVGELVCRNYENPTLIHRSTTTAPTNLKRGCHEKNGPKNKRPRSTHSSISSALMSECFKTDCSTESEEDSEEGSNLGDDLKIDMPHIID